MEDKRLLVRYHHDGDQGAREEVVQQFMPLARKLARRYQRGSEPLDDLFQIASLGLIKAVDRFDPDRGTSFSSFAVPTILGELKRYFRDTGWAAHVPRGMQERVLRVDRAGDELFRALGRPPSVAEIASEVGIEADEVLEAMQASVAYDAVSLEAPRYADDGEGETLADTLGSEDDALVLVEYEAAIEPGMRLLEKRDRLVLALRFREDMTQSEIAEKIGISQMHVSRLIRRALTVLREAAGGESPA